MPYPNQNYAMPGYGGQPVPGNWNAAPPQMPVMASLATGGPKPPAAPRPTIRLQAPETLLVKPAATLTLPSPESLGISPSNPVPAAASPLDWNDVHARLQRLGAVGFHLDRLSTGLVRATFMLPTSDQRAQPIEAIAETEPAAVRAALENAQTWAARRAS